MDVYSASKLDSFDCKVTSATRRYLATPLTETSQVSNGIKKVVAREIEATHAPLITWTATRQRWPKEALDSNMRQERGLSSHLERADTLGGTDINCSQYCAKKKVWLEPIVQRRRWFSSRQKSASEAKPADCLGETVYKQLDVLEVVYALNHSSGEHVPQEMKATI